ncbi:hypothetical protein BN946_scf184325.g12 [Trametes cinnabarina]|uniref:Response regulatory domain-containing protein n=1 Tax=Pycnoporus cinnabarinus TaxID=5643 RepID=A0A060SJN7_PYCCI|nr:hypothetical protein BN946_scf184325.g12 [Trametes cinnabarina]
MSGTRLPSVRLPPIVAGQAADEEGAGAVLVELPSSNRFGITWPAEQPPPISAPAERPTAVSLSSSEGETDVSEEEHSAREAKPARVEECEESEFVTPTNHLNSDQNPLEQIGQASTIPRISRALSMPLPSQLGPFQHPRRISSSSESSAVIAEPPVQSSHLEELSLELADSVQMVVQILLQLSPPQVLDPAKEQFSACSLSIPTPSVSAMLTSMKNLNYMSANMSAFSLDSSSPQAASIGRHNTGSARTHVDFDIGEMLQSVGDSLSGVAAQAGVDLVLFHDDLGMRHVAVKGDESGLSYILSHILRQVISVAKRGDSIEVGLFIESAKGPLRSPSPGSVPRSGSPQFGTDEPLRCSFHIAHRFGMSEPNSPVVDLSAESGIDASSPPPTRNQPSFNTLMLRRLLQHVDAQLEVDAPSRVALVGRCCVLGVTLDRGSPSVVDPAVSLAPEEAAYLGYPSELRIAQEPTLAQLTQFAESLKGRKVTLIAHSKGSFARHLTSYLTAWGLDVSHVSTEPNTEGFSETGEAAPEGESGHTREGVPATIPEQGSPPAPTPPPQPTGDPFILIDDDVPALRARLQKFRAEQAYPLNLHARKRPSLASNHRPRSSPQVARVIGMNTQPIPTVPQVIVHYTSLANFKLVKDAVQSIIAPGNAWARLPEVIVVPKPAGPRRILTALHTAVTKPVVDPFFAPIATSPVSPSFHPMSPLFSGPSNQHSPGGRSAGGLRTGSDRLTRSPKEALEPVSGVPPSSPLGMSDNIEYFSDAAARLGASPASGLVIQSPDGQPAGIFFHPKSKGKGAERGQTEYATGRPRGSSYRRSSDGEDPRKGLTSPQTETHRRSPRPPSAAETRPIETVYEAGSPSLGGGKGRQRELSISEEAIGEPEALPTEQVPSPIVAPRIPRRTSQDPRHSPPLSPQTRTAGGGAGLSRRPSKRPTAETTQSSPAAIPKKGTRGTENNIVPPISVLIVDDNPINQTILSTFMKKKKIKYDVAKNGEEAVQKWRSGGFHLILMDIQMPVMDGIQATKEIRRIEKSNGVGGFPSTPQSEGQQTPSEASTSDTNRSATSPSYRSSVIIVALTASSLQSDRVAALAAGCNDFLTKPVSLHWLNNKIIEWGSIKALQMWADIRPEVVRSITTGQAVQARNVASRLHVPEGRSTPLAPRSRSPSQPSQSRKPFSLDAAKAAAETLSKADRPIERSYSTSDDAPKVSPPSSGGSGEAGQQPSDTTVSTVPAPAQAHEARLETPLSDQGASQVAGEASTADTPATVTVTRSDDRSPDAVPEPPAPLAETQAPATAEPEEASATSDPTPPGADDAAAGGANDSPPPPPGQ